MTGNNINQTPQEQLDQTALTYSLEAKLQAQEAVHKIESHEDLCGLRYKRMEETYDSTKQGIAKLENEMKAGHNLIFDRINKNHTAINAKFWIILTSVIAALFAVILLLLSR